MTEQKPSKNNAKQQPVKTIRSGAVAASIWKRQTPTGFAYLDFTLSRSWKTKIGDKEGYSQSFFDSNEEALTSVINKASNFIREFSAKAQTDDATAGESPAAATSRSVRATQLPTSDGAVVV